MPQVSVVMPVHNAMPYLTCAIESILQQTFGDFEFIIGDDDSSDGSSELISHFAAQDSRIKVLRAPSRLGPAASSKWTAEAAKASLIARMDADDVSHPERLRLQVAALRGHPRAVLVASLPQTIDRKGVRIRDVDYSVLINRPRLEASHPSIMYRRETYWAVGGYQEQTDYFEDRVFIDKIQGQGDVLVIAAPLISYRMSGTSARINDNQITVEESLTRLDVFVAVGHDPSRTQRCISPLAYRSIGSMRLWCNHPAKILPAMMQRMRLYPLTPALSTFLWAAIVTFMPSVARAAGRTSLAWRNRRAVRHVRRNHLYRWVANGPSEDLGPAGI